MRAHELGQVLRREYSGPTENFVVLEVLDSTNLLARRMATEFVRDEAVAPRTLLLALEQTAGRGRQGHSWSSPSGLGVYATLLLPIARRDILETLAMRVGVGLAQSVGEMLSYPCGLKWPNDLLVDGKKIGGVLIESVSRSSEKSVALIGFGVNHGHGAQALPNASSTSLALAGSSLEPLGVVAARLLMAIEHQLDRADEASLVADYTDLSVHRLGDRLECRLGNEVASGAFVGFDGHGFLRLRTAQGERLLSAGEVVEG
jgi:BirA family biotin operon repressor/biotin-[acetyl-CoA-carboxylase] ligase